MRCFIAATLAYQFMTNTAMAESSGHGVSITAAREPTSSLDPLLREKAAPSVVSSNSSLADSTLVEHKGEVSTLTANNPGASASAERGIEAAEVAEASSNGSGAGSAPLTTAELTASLEYDILNARLNGDLTQANALSQSLQALSLIHI